MAAVIVIEPSSKDQENPEQRNILYHILSMPAPKLNESGKRLLRDLKNLHKDPPAGIAASPIDNNIYVVFIVVLLGMMLTHCTNTTGTKSVQSDKTVEKSKKKVNAKKPGKNKSDGRKPCRLLWGTLNKSGFAEKSLEFIGFFRPCQPDCVNISKTKS